jgi:hypothetical protein
LIHAPAVFSAGTVNADFSLRVDGRLSGEKPIAQALERVPGA